MPSVAVRDHRGNSLPYVEALAAKGWDVVPLGQRADVLLIDLDIDRPGYRDVIHAYAEAGARIVLYPHGANALTCWDGLDEPYPVDLCVVPGEGHRMVMEAYGYPRPILVAGFSFCGIRRFRPSRGERVLFAPIHPLGSGWLAPRDKAANEVAFRTLLQTGRPLVVRYMGTLAENGLWEEPGVTFVRADVDPVDHIDSADVVVAHGTFLSMSVARGRPSVSFHQVEPMNDAENPGEVQFPVRSWDRYREIMRYPHDLGDPLALETACAVEANGWRERFVGRPLDANLLNDRLRSLVAEAVVA